MNMIAMVDRIEGDFAVLLVGSDEVQVDVSLELLPYTYKGAVFYVVT
jgi:hypothetical protein